MNFDLVRAKLLCELCFTLEPWHVYLHPNVRLTVSPIAKSQYFLTDDGPSVYEKA